VAALGLREQPDGPGGRPPWGGRLLTTDGSVRVDHPQEDAEDLLAHGQVPATAFEAKHMVRDELRGLGLRNQLSCRTLAFSGVLGTSVFVSIFEWDGDSEQWASLQRCALDNGFCVERAYHGATAAQAPEVSVVEDKA
jgi:hypothetical protein